MKRFAAVAVLIVLSAVCSFAQSAPSALPGYTVQLNAGYSSVQGNSSNGMFASLAVPIWTRNSTNTMTVSARSDWFSITNPSTFVITAGPEFRYQFSRATLLNGIVFQPFANTGIGAARSQCVSTNSCPVGADTSSHITEKLGGGLDVIMDTHSTIRIFEVDYIHSRIFPGGHVVMSNFAQVSAGIGFRF